MAHFQTKKDAIYQRKALIAAAAIAFLTLLVLLFRGHLPTVLTQLVVGPKEPPPAEEGTVPLERMPRYEIAEQPQTDPNKLRQERERLIDSL